MDLLVPSTGRIFRRVDDCIALMLMEAFPESFKRVDPRQPAGVPEQPKVPVFFIAPSAHTGNPGLHCRKPNGETTSVYSASSKAAAETALGAGEIPQNIWDAFVAKTSTGIDPEWAREKISQQKAADAARQQKEKEQSHRWM